jgi:hypothetical protein
MTPELIAKIAECIIELGSLIRDEGQEDILAGFNVEHDEDYVRVYAKIHTPHTPSGLSRFIYQISIDVYTLQTETDGF